MIPFQLESARIAVVEPERVEQRDDRDQRGVLEQADEVVDDAGDRDLQRLRHDDQPHRLPVVEAERVGGLVLAARQGGEAAADGLGDVGRREQRHHDDDAQDDVEVGARRQEDVEQERGDEQQRDQRHAADELDEADADRLDHEQVRAPPEREQDAERQREGDAGDADRQRQREAAELLGADRRQRRRCRWTTARRRRARRGRATRSPSRAGRRSGRARSEPRAEMTPVDQRADHETGVDHDRHEDRAAPEQPVGDAGEERARTTAACAAARRTGSARARRATG